MLPKNSRRALRSKILGERPLVERLSSVLDEPVLVHPALENEPVALQDPTHQPKGFLERPPKKALTRHIPIDFCSPQCQAGRGTTAKFAGVEAVALGVLDVAVEATEDAPDALGVRLAVEELAPARPDAAFASSFELLLEREPTTPPTTAATMTTTATGTPILIHLLIPPEEFLPTIVGEVVLKRRGGTG